MFGLRKIALFALIVLVVLVFIGCGQATLKTELRFKEGLNAESCAKIVEAFGKWNPIIGTQEKCMNIVETAKRGNFRVTSLTGIRVPLGAQAGLKNDPL